MAGIKPGGAGNKVDDAIDKFINPSLKPMSKRDEQNYLLRFTSEAKEFLNKTFSFVIYTGPYKQRGYPDIIITDSFVFAGTRFLMAGIWLKPKGMQAATNLHQDKVMSEMESRGYFTIVTDSIGDLTRNVKLYYQEYYV